MRDVFDVIRETPQHTYQVLTKRAHRMARFANKLEWPDNLWMGVSIESFDAVDRIDHLRATPAAVRFLSCEPLITALPNLDLTDIDWVIAGGESGPNARAMDPEWVADIRDQCTDADVAFFFKLALMSIDGSQQSPLLATSTPRRLTTSRAGRGGNTKTKSRPKPSSPRNRT